ncbi:hypothetical protein As57867_005461, partial [Aphanomyces stellatus]
MSYLMARQLRIENAKKLIRKQEEKARYKRTHGRSPSRSPSPEPAAPTIPQATAHWHPVEGFYDSAEEEAETEDFEPNADDMKAARRQLNKEAAAKCERKWGVNPRGPRSRATLEPRPVDTPLPVNMITSKIEAPEFTSMDRMFLIGWLKKRERYERDLEAEARPLGGWWKHQAKSWKDSMNPDLLRAVC